MDTAGWACACVCVRGTIEGVTSQPAAAQKIAVVKRGTGETDREGRVYNVDRRSVHTAEDEHWNQR